MLRRQPAPDDLAHLELELQGKMSERAMLGRLLDEAQKKSVADVYERRIGTGAGKEQAKLKAGAQVAFQERATSTEVKNKIDLVSGKNGFTVKARIELSYLGLTDAEGTKKAAADVPRIERVLRDAWTVDLTEGIYAGKKFSLEPQIEFRSNTRTPNDKAWQFIVRHDPKGDTVADFSHGEVSFNPAHLQGDRIISAAHELYHLFGFIVDQYYIPQKGAKGVAAAYVAGRRDLAGRPDLLGMVDPTKLREWLDKGFISVDDFKRQTNAQIRVWQEDAERILYALGAPANPAKAAARDDPNSPDFDPSEGLRATEGKIKQRIADQESAASRYADIAQSVEYAERAIRLDEEIAELQKKIAQRKSGGAKTPTKP